MQSNKDRLIELFEAVEKDPAITCAHYKTDKTCDTCKYTINNYLCNHTERMVDYLLANGVIVTPCVAMVEQFLKDGEFDRKRTAHNGRIAVVYIDKSKWNSPLIDITEQFYNTDKAEERIQALKECEGK